MDGWQPSAVVVPIPGAHSPPAPHVPTDVVQVRWQRDSVRMHGPHMREVQVAPTSATHGVVSTMAMSVGLQVPAPAQLPPAQERTAVPVQPANEATQAPTSQLTHASPVGSYTQGIVSIDTTGPHAPPPHTRRVVVTAATPSAEQPRPVVSQLPIVVSGAPHSVPVVERAQLVGASLPVQAPSTQV